MELKKYYVRDLSVQFLLASLPIFICGTIFIGSWVSSRIEQSTARHIGSVTGAYVESFVARHVQPLTEENELTQENKNALSNLLAKTTFGKKVVLLKIWDLNGKILYSNDPSLTGKSFPIEAGLKTAYLGNIYSEISTLSHEENKNEDATWDRLIETYIPIRTQDDGKVNAVAEFYQTTEELSKEAAVAQLQSWGIVALTFFLTYLLLFGLVHQGSKTIRDQRKELQHQISQLIELNDQNRHLHERVQRAAARAASLNEHFLRRISADLHDGLGQYLGLAVMKMQTVGNGYDDNKEPKKEKVFNADDFQTIQNALKSALHELRTICIGLRLPEIGNLTANGVAMRAVRDYQKRSGIHPIFKTLNEDCEISLPSKIALYRIMQESLMNGYRHANGVGQAIQLNKIDDWLIVEIRDSGKGFDPVSVWHDSRLGLKGMRERVEVLGGSFDIVSATGRGTIIRATLPINVERADDD